jgi:hypothetical protein
VEKYPKEEIFRFYRNNHFVLRSEIRTTVKEELRERGCRRKSDSVSVITPFGYKNSVNIKIIWTLQKVP